MKPGFTRLNLSYFASDEEIDYILNAIEFLAYHAWKFLPLVLSIFEIRIRFVYFSIRMNLRLVYGIIEKRIRKISIV